MCTFSNSPPFQSTTGKHLPPNEGRYLPPTRPHRPSPPSARSVRVSTEQVLACSVTPRRPGPSESAARSELRTPPPAPCGPPGSRPPPPAARPRGPRRPGAAGPGPAARRGRCGRGGARAGRWRGGRPGWPWSGAATGRRRTGGPWRARAVGEEKGARGGGGRIQSRLK